MIRITSLFVVALAAHSLGQAAAWSGCAAYYASADCSGDIIAGSDGCGPVNEGCEEDTDSGTWDKSVSTAGTCVDGAVVYQSNGNADEAACNLANATANPQTVGECVVVAGVPGYGSMKTACTSLTGSAATTTASAVVVLLAAVASQMF